MATYYINADSGNDSTGAGTSGNPWATISKAISSSVATDTIMLQKSTAHYLWANQTISNRTLSGVTNNPLDAVIDAGGLDVTYTFGNPVAFTGLRFTNLIKTGAGKVFDYSTGVTSIFTNCQFDTIKFWPSNLNFNGCWSSTNVAMNITMTNCLIYNVVQAAGSTSGGSMFAANTSTGPGSLDLEHTTIYIPSGSKLGQVVVMQYGSNALAITVKNCLVQNLDATMASFSGSSSTSLTKNASYSFLNGTNMTTGLTLVAGNSTADPLFIDPSTNFNFNLQAASPAIGAGTL
jgi:hypothetical protein